MSQSLVNERRRRAHAALRPGRGAAIMLVVAVFLAGLLRDLPQPVLAAIVLMAVTGLFKVAELRRLWRFSRAEFARRRGRARSACSAPGSCAAC